MSVAGEVAITVAWDGARVGEVTVAVGRPQAARLLVGRSVDEARLFVPRLYSVCARAQAAAARAALAAALGEASTRSVEEEAGAAVPLLAEAAQEHLWRLLRDWPAALGLPTRDAEFAQWYRRLAALAEGQWLPSLLAFVEEALGGGFERASDLAEALAWARSDERLGALLLRAVAEGEGDGGAGDEQAAVGWLDRGRPLDEVVAPVLDSDDGAPRPFPWPVDWIERPALASGPAETGALARWREAPAIADGLRRRGRSQAVRLLARLHDLLAVARALAGPRAGRLGEAGAGPVAPPLAGPDGLTLAPGVGVARVDTARGVLLHGARVRLEDRRVQRYAIVAPTNWNFHPAGALARALGGLAAGDEGALRAAVGRWVLALDPCVPWRLEVSRA